jgi:hypothetical protein
MPRARTTIGSTFVVVCLCLWGLANVRFALRNVNDHWRPSPDYAPAAFVPRFAPLAAYLPAKATIGYMLDADHADVQRRHPDARYALAQYCLAPRLIARTADFPLVIVDSDDAESPPGIAQERGWTIVADLHNGVRLYRTERARQ